MRPRLLALPQHGRPPRQRQDPPDLNVLGPWRCLRGAAIYVASLKSDPLHRESFALFYCNGCEAFRVPEHVGNI